MSILIVGADGNMGHRYRAIMRYLGKEVLGTDRQHNRHHVKAMAEKSEGIIVATPTATHVDIIRDLIPLGKPILCEKPVTKDVSQIKELAKELGNTPFRMVFQYSLLAEKNRIGRSYYDYFKHGSDGLGWDCMQVIAISRQRPDLGEESPIWKCMINGKPLQIGHMDAAYIAYCQEWFKKPSQDMGEIIAAHEKTHVIAKEIAHELH